MRSVQADGVANALERFAGALRARFGSRVSEVVLFGSHARGDAHEDSDVDVLAVIDELTDAERREVVDTAYDLDAAAEEWVGLSVLACSTKEARDRRRTGRRLWDDIAREGIAL